MGLMRKILGVIAVIMVSLSVVSCTKNTAELGTAENPVKLQFVPSVDAKVIEHNSKKIKEYLEAHTPYKYEVTIPQSYIAVVEAFGTKRADISAINTSGYVLAYSKYGAEARLTVLRHGAATYQSMFIAKADGPIKKLEDLKGKKVAFVDPSSASGYILPKKSLNDKKVEIKETVFAQKHDNVISMVYQGQVDAGAAFYSPPSKNASGSEEIEDARRLVKTQYPDVEKKIAIIDLSQHIPNDPIVFRKDMPEEMKNKIADAFISFVSTEDGKATFFAVYGADDIKKATDADYDSVREMLKTVGVNPDDLMKK